jgi:hypothetical protein
LDDSAVLSDENARLKAPIEGIHFVSKTNGQHDDGLIEYIKKETGKMKALAQADLDSYIMLAQQFLNIGKPFYIEGVGMLHKKRDGSIEFGAGTAVAVNTIKGTDEEEKKRSAFADEDKQKGGGGGPNMRVLIIALGIIGTIAVIAGGGYFLYSKNTDDTATTSASNLRVVADTQTTTNITPDTTQSHAPAPVVTAPAGYKFILETTARKSRALQRYETIKTARIVKGYDSPIQMETKDSVNFKIYMVLNCPPQDTARYKEQMNAWYYGSQAMKIKIE